MPGKTPSMTPRRTTAAFRSSARLISILGENLIGNNVVGLLELVKNGYDADGTRVQVRLENLGEAQWTRVSVEDDGAGMTLEDVTSKFLCPAVDHKLRQKGTLTRTARGRLPLGEKGVGRFAIQKLGRDLELVTRASGASEVWMRVDWDLFENSEVSLHEVPIEIEERDPQIFTGARTGTRLVMSRSRDAWKRRDVEDLARGLRRLCSPLEALDKGGLQDFQVELECSEYPDLTHLDPGDILDRSHYEFRALIDVGGAMDYEYIARHPRVPARQTSGQQSIVGDARGQLSGERPACGPFLVNLYVWERTAGDLKDSGISRDDLDQNAGVSLFRDKLRVLPYGERGDDWLDLDRERLNSPSERISNNQVIGLVEVDQAQNPGLCDKTNREGLIENNEFRDLRVMVRTAIAHFHTLWAQDRPARTERTATASGGAAGVSESPLEPIRRAKNVARAVQASSRSDVLVSILDTSGLEFRDDRPSTCPSPRTITQQEAAKLLLREIDRASTAEEAAEDLRARREEVLLHLAATGMAAERVVHEFGRQVHAALGALDSLRQGGIQADRALQVLAACLGTLRNEFRVLAPYHGPRRFQRAETVSVRESIETAALLNNATFECNAVLCHVHGDDFSVRARPASLIQVFDNLFANAAAWLQARDHGRRVDVLLNSGTRIVRITDNGPGVAESARHSIFSEFVSTRPGGRGLGLYVTRELMHSIGGAIRLVDDDCAPGPAGACFELQFPQPDD